jgi:hypothetical protein
MYLTLALLVAGAAAVPSPSAPITNRNLAAPAGKKIQWVGHSFHMFLPGPVAQLAKEAGITGHQNIGLDMIPASVPCQHWNKGGAVKNVLTAGTADVLTIATREDVPDPCIPKFIKLAAQKRPDMHVMVQETWLPVSAALQEGLDPNNLTLTKTYSDKPSKNTEKCAGFAGCSARDAATFKTLERTRNELEGPYRNRLRKQLADLNKEIGKNISILVPVWDATISLRQMIVNGKVPGIAKQSELFMDGLGHARKPLQDMASYLWFGALYNQSPVGMKALDGKSNGQAEVLQKIAWDALKREPLSGVQNR